MNFKDIINISSLGLAFSVLVFLFSLFIFSCMGFILHININVFYFPLSIIISQIAYYCLLCRKYKLPPKIFIINFLIFITVTFFSCIIATNFYDYSYDGRTYHQAQIMLLNQGWNPVYDNLTEFITKNYPTTLYHIPWIDGYTKFTEIVQSNILAVFNNIETSKMTIFMSAVMLFSYAFHILGKKAFDKLNFLSRIIICSILVFNPIFVAQMQTFYVDSYMYVFFILIILAVIDIEAKTDNRDIIPFSIIIMSAVCFLNIKFWAYIYFCTMGLVYLLYLFANKQYERIKKVALSSLIILILVVMSGLNPYLTNIKQGRNVIYPVLGCQEADTVMVMNMPKSFYGKTSVHQFFISTFSRVDNFRMMENKTHHLKVPFEVNDDEFYYLKGYDTRICGFGIFWSAILLLTCILACFIKYREKKIYLLVFMILLANLIFQPFSWWARFIPQLWAFPVFVVLYYLSEQNVSKTKQLAAVFLLVIMFLNISVQSYFVSQNGKYYKDIVNYVISSLLKQDKTVQIYTIYDWSIIEKLRENGIKTEFVSDDYFENNKQKFEPVVPQIEGNMFWRLKD